MTDPEITKKQIEDGQRLFSGRCDFMLGVAGLEQLPTADRAEVAFAGRSNVGKSSLLNALTKRTNLARTSHTPGRTQQLNFFDLGGVIYLVDMPGYGYAKVSKQQRKEWDKLIRSYLSGRQNLRCVFVLVDSRHGLKDSDKDLMTMLDETAVPYRIVLTKCDKIKSQELAHRIEEVKTALKNHPAAYPDPYQCSAHKKQGVEELRAAITVLQE